MRNKYKGLKAIAQPGQQIVIDEYDHPWMVKTVCLASVAPRNVQAQFPGYTGFLYQAKYMGRINGQTVWWMEQDITYVQKYELVSPKQDARSPMNVSMHATLCEDLPVYEILRDWVETLPKGTKAETGLDVKRTLAFLLEQCAILSEGGSDNYQRALDNIYNILQ